MLKRLALSAFLGAIALGSIGLANAAVVGPGSASGLRSQDQTITTVRWVCGPRRCMWEPNYRGTVVVPRFARRWGPPVRPTCFYERRRRHWILVCP
jgi:hypothetical protein